MFFLPKAQQRILGWNTLISHHPLDDLKCMTTNPHSTKLTLKGWLLIIASGGGVFSFLWDVRRRQDPTFQQVSHVPDARLCVSDVGSCEVVLQTASGVIGFLCKRILVVSRKGCRLLLLVQRF